MKINQGYSQTLRNPIVHSIILRKNNQINQPRVYVITILRELYHLYFVGADGSVRLILCHFNSN
jgi:hypothetical protein